MKVLLQRVTSAEVTIKNTDYTAAIGRGLVVLLGIGQTDTEETADYLITKLLGLRIFPGEPGKSTSKSMDRSVTDINGEILVVSQFTLYADCRKGKRPSFDQAAPPEKAETLYNYFISQLKTGYPHIKTGRFAADMNVRLDNDGPVTIMLEQ